MSISLLLFDLDGTLMDTAPDMGAALNELRAEHKLDPFTQDRIRPHVSHGVPALLKLGFGLEPQDTRFAEMRARYLAIYQTGLAKETRLFHGIEPLLETLGKTGYTWGIVTNKPGWLTEPLLDAFGMRSRAACVVSGDTTPRRKPFPDPLLHAAATMRVEPSRTLYVGDDERDVRAARAAGMPVVVAGYGYLGDGAPPAQWGADAVLDSCPALHAWIVDTIGKPSKRVAR